MHTATSPRAGYSRREMGRGGSFGASALAALMANDVDELKRIFGETGADINAAVMNGSYGGCVDFGEVKYEAGDTLLHMALRNKKWPIRQCCVVDLSADATLKNETGVSPVGMNIRTSAPRLASALFSLAVVYYDVLDIGELVGELGWWVIGAFALVSFADTMLAVRYYFISHYHKEFAPAASKPSKTKSSGKKKRG